LKNSRRPQSRKNVTIDEDVRDRELAANAPEQTPVDGAEQRDCGEQGACEQQHAGNGGEHGHPLYDAVRSAFLWRSL
jgi:hypothetical protein